MTTEFYTHVQAYGNKIICRGYRDGKRFRDVVSYKPYLFVPVKVGAKADAYTIEGQPVMKYEFENIREARDFVEKYKEVKDFKYYGMTNYIYPFINDRYPNSIIELVDGKLVRRYDPNLISIVSLDIEVASPDGFPDLETADQPITAITLTKKGRSYTFGMKPYKVKKEHKGRIYCYCKTEEEMLDEFLRVWSTDSYWMPDVVTGWYIEFFDIPYLVRRIIRVLGEGKEKRLSPNALVQEREVVVGKNRDEAAKKHTAFEISGLTVADYQPLYKRFNYITKESYSLKFISEYELGETKLEYEGTLEELYHNDFEKFIDYNIQDAFLVERLEHKLNYLQQLISIAYRAKINYNDAMTTSRPWDVIAHNHLMAKGFVIPQTTPPEHSRKIIGAFVKDVMVGFHRWVVSVDYDSLYPRIISQQNISNDTFVDMVKLPQLDVLVSKKAFPPQTDLTICGNGSRYRKDKRGFIPELVDQFIEERVLFKKQMIELKKEQEKNKTEERETQIKHLDNYQQSWKILTNGLYGALAMKYFRWYDIRLAEAVTTTGQYAVRTVLNDLNTYLNKILKTEGQDFIVASDTDSCYINLGPLVEKLGIDKKSTPEAIDFMCKVMEEGINKRIKKSCVEICATLNAYIPKLNMKQEAVCDKALWRAKKNYILNIWDDEGVRYKEPKLKIKGMEAIRSSTPQLSRDAIKGAIKIMMNNTEKDLQQFVTDFKERFYQMPFSKIAFPRSVSNLEKYWNDTTGFGPKCPPNVRGSITYNNLLKAKKLTKKYHTIKNKDKIRWAYLKDPNPIHSKTIASLDELPPEFNLQDYIDYDQQYENTFLSPIKSLTDIMGWNTSYIPTLKKFFKRKEKANG